MTAAGKYGSIEPNAEADLVPAVSVLVVYYPPPLLLLGVQQNGMNPIHGSGVTFLSAGTWVNQFATSLAALASVGKVPSNVF